MRKTTTYLMFTLIILSTSITGQIPTDGLIGFYGLDGNAMDSSPSKIDGEIFGDVMAVEDRLGNAESALLFDGFSGYIDIPDTPIFNLTQAITIALWVKPVNVSDLGFTALVNKFEIGAGGPMGYYLGLDPQNALITWNLFSVSGGSSVLQSDQWTHITVSYDSSGDLRMYTNCILEVFGPAIDSIQPSTVPLRIGQQSQILGNAQFFNGAMDDVLIYDRALTIEEVEGICSVSTTSVADILQNEVVVYPNPFNNILNVKSTSDDYVRAEIVNVKGELVEEISNSQLSQNVTTNHLSDGAYFLKLYTEEGKTITKKIIKNSVE